jgi:hypothetical protein
MTEIDSALRDLIRQNVPPDGKGIGNKALLDKLNQSGDFASTSTSGTGPTG